MVAHINYYPLSNHSNYQPPYNSPIMTLGVPTNDNTQTNYHNDTVQKNNKNYTFNNI